MRSLLSILILLVFLPFYAQDNTRVKIDMPPQESISEFSIRQGTVFAAIAIPEIYIENFTGDAGNFSRISLPGYYASNKTGSPEIPVLSLSAELDPSVSYTIKVLSLDSSLIELNSIKGGGPLYPVQASALKNKDLVTEFTAGNDSVYGSDDWFRLPLFEIENMGLMRGLDLANIHISPFKYHPVRNELLVYHHLVFELIPDNPPVLGTQDKPSYAFERVFKNVLREKESVVLKRVVADQAMTMVILSDTVFREGLQDFIKWKTEKGFNIVEAYTSDSLVGATSSEIKAYMSGLYHDPPQGIAPPTFLLIVGDATHVPISQSSGQITDLYYTTFDGQGDYLPEMFHGRISVKNDTQLLDVLEKTLIYEKYLFQDPEFLERAILIAGDDNSYAYTHGNGQINYANEYYFNEENDIDPYVFLHPEARSSDSIIRAEIDRGAGFVNYTGHGQYDGWIDPSFRTSHLPLFESRGNFGLIMGNGCRTNVFTSSSDCFAEALLKAKMKGAVGYIGCTNDSYWDEDYYWSVGLGPISSNPSYGSTAYGYYDKVFHKQDEPLEIWSPSMGEMIFAGNMSVQESSSSRKQYYWEIYQLMGDPSLVPWFGIPSAFPVEFSQMIPREARNISVLASAYDQVAISSNGQLIDAQHCDPYGQAFLSIPDTLGSDKMLLVVTGDKRQPFIDTIYRNGSQAYLDLLEYSYSQESKKDDDILANGEQFSLSLKLVNRGSEPMEAQDLLLFCSDNYIQISDSIYNLNSIQAGDTLLLSGIFKLSVSDSLKDGSRITLGLRSTSPGAVNRMLFRETLHAPILSSGGIWWDDALFGNGNGILDPGEKIRFIWKVDNSGSYTSDTLIAHFELSELAAFFKELVFLKTAPVDAGASGFVRFNATLQDSLYDFQGNTGSLELSDGVYQLEDNINILTSRHVEDFSTGNANSFNWQSADWAIDSLIFNNSPYSLRSGTIPHESSSSLFLEIDLAQLDSIVFDLKVSSESTYDFLELYVDSIMVDRWSGYIDWMRASVLLSQGRHILEWRYAKDESVSKGLDAAWIDNIIFPLNSYDSIDIGVLKVLSPKNASFLGSEESIRVAIINSGKNEIHGFEMGYSFEQAPWQESSISESILPGEIIEVELPAVFDMSDIQTYSLKVSVSAPNDMFRGNDTLFQHIDHYAFPDISIKEIGLDSVEYVYTDIILEIRNQGNTLFTDIELTKVVDSLINPVLLEGISLEPGKFVELPIRILETEEAKTQGWYEYRIIASPDSISVNNQISGTVYWKVLGLELFNEDKLQIYPNPARGILNISISDQIGRPALFEIFELSGKLIYSRQIIELKMEIDTEKVFSRPGIYMIRVSDSGRQQLISGKVIVYR